MTEALVETKTTALANPLSEMGVNPKEIIMPVLVMRQPTFKKEHMKASAPGDILQLPQGILVAKYGEKVEVVPLSIRKQYRVMDMTKQSEPKCVRYEDWKENAEWEWTEDGKKMRRDQCYTVFFLFRSQLEKQGELFEAVKNGEIIDPDDFALPVRVTFSRAAFAAGKVLSAYFELAKAANNQTPAAMTWLLKAQEKTNEHGTWYVFDIEKPLKERKMTPKDLLPTANMWVKILQTTDVKMAEDDSEIIEVETSAESTPKF